MRALSRYHRLIDIHTTHRNIYISFLFLQRFSVWFVDWLFVLLLCCVIVAPAGRYQSDTGQSDCIDTEAGYYTPAPFSVGLQVNTQPIACVAGQHSHSCIPFPSLLPPPPLPWPMCCSCLQVVTPIAVMRVNVCRVSRAHMWSVQRRPSVWCVVWAKLPINPL